MDELTMEDGNEPEDSIWEKEPVTDDQHILEQSDARRVRGEISRSVQRVSADGLCEPLTN